MHLIVIIIFILFSIAYLTGFFNVYKKADLSFSTLNNGNLIEFLTQHKTKNRNYNRKAEGFTSFNKRLVGKKINDKAFFRYEFPLIDSQNGVFETTFHPTEVSQEVDYFGLQDSLILKEKNGYRINITIPEAELQQKMNKDGWYFNSYDDAGVDYKFLVNKYSTFSSEIANQIYSTLTKKGLDSYYNRVQAALNFIQFIPYGRPDFDAEGWYYHEISVPPETFIIGYGDCDSKSIFFASILCNLIPLKNTLLVECLVNSTNRNSNGEHMMVAISELGIKGESVMFKEIEYLLIETTQPIKIGQFDWQSYQVKNIIELT